MIDIGSVVNGKYRLVRVLGDGGMGSVYEAQHVALGTRVAIKVLHPELARRSGLVERFLQEARVAAQIRSAHVVQVVDVDRTPDGHAYIVMELLEGEPLSSVLDRQRKLPVTIACAYTTQILQALEAAHALGVIHRDLKPENVFVTFVGGKPNLKLIDFGIAKAHRTDPQQKQLTVAGVLMGTAEYMAPEQARSADKVDARADVYAVGVMLYEMIAGVRPAGGDDARIIALKVERGDVTPLLQAAPDAPREIAGLVHRAMAARPQLRFASATEMRLAIEAAASGRRGPTPTVGRPVAGTVELSAGRATSPEPARASGSISSPEADAPVVTIRAPPIATALTPPVVAGPGVPAFSAIERQPSALRSNPLTVALIGVLALIGVGVDGAAIFVLVGAHASGPSTATEAMPSASAGAPPARSTAAEPTATPGSTDVPSLAPTKAAPAPAHPSLASPPSRAPAALVDAAAAPEGFPPTAPVIPPFRTYCLFLPAFPRRFQADFRRRYRAASPPLFLPAFPPSYRRGHRRLRLRRRRPRKAAAVTERALLRCAGAFPAHRAVAPAGRSMARVDAGIPLASRSCGRDARRGGRASGRA